VWQQSGVGLDPQQAAKGFDLKVLNLKAGLTEKPVQLAKAKGFAVIVYAAPK
jgi:hypothetical protein